MRHYCTLFDSKYLPQGLALYDSLVKHSSEAFTLCVLAMDTETLRTLQSLNFQNVLPMDGRSFLLNQRIDRTWQEFCWTCASNLAEDVMDWADKDVDDPWYLEHLTYIDADCYFFSDPKVIFDEIGDRSIAVIPHRLIPSKKHLEVNGQFNVSWVTFKNNDVGRECLSTWAAQCRERCSAKIGCGDQKYLDEFPVKYGDELCVIENIGAGLAPWNLAHYTLTEGPKVDGNDVVFYHYHEYLHGQRLTNYELRDEDVKYIYAPYFAAVSRAQETVASTIHLQA